MNDRSVTAPILLMLTCLLLGLLTGAMLVIGVALVSFWRSLSPSDFQVWFAAHSHLIGRLTLPLGIGSLAVSAIAVIAGWRSSARRWLLIAAVSAIGVMVTYPLFFATANETFVRGGLLDAAARPCSIAGRHGTGSVRGL